MTDMENDIDLRHARLELGYVLDRHKVEFDWTDDLVARLEALIDVKLALMVEAMADRIDALQGETK